MQVRFYRMLAVCMMAVWCFATSAAADPSPEAVVQRFQAGLLDIMKAAHVLGLKGRFRRIGPLVDDSFHLPLMAATASAPYWRKASPADRKRLVSAFRDMSVASVATLFDDYGGETFRVVRARKTANPRAMLVDTQIVLPGDDPVDITYVAANLQRRWWIIDIIVGGGISEIKVRRSEYQPVLRKGGLPALAAALEAKAGRMLSGKEKASAHGAGR